MCVSLPRYSTNPTHFKETYLKLRAKCQGARLLRGQSGGQ